MMNMKKGAKMPISLIAVVCEKLRAFGMENIGFSIDRNVVAIKYVAHNRSTLNYDELLQLKQIINPDSVKYPIPIGYFGEYTFYVRIAK